MNSTGKTCMALAFILATACTGEFKFENGPDNPPTAADAGTSSGEAYFQANILPLISRSRPKGACATCHQGDNPSDNLFFLGASVETSYTSLLNAPGLIGATPAESRFYVRGDHAGDAFEPAELSEVASWIELEQ